MQERLDDIISFRRKKLEALRSAGVDPYPSRTNRTHTNAHIAEHFNALKDTTVTAAGRIRSMRTMGKLVFAHIEDGTGKIQVLLREDTVGKERLKFFLQVFDIGDFAECTGSLFTTKSGEKTLLVRDYRMLAKSLRPLPSEHYGLEDVETRLRKRYLELLLDPAVKDIFRKKAAFWNSMRNVLAQDGFLEVEMPVLEGTPGGAEAEPFVTHHQALDRDFFLRISLELPLKKMLVAGFEKVFEIGRIFRNEGMSAEHLQDYTQMEFYWAYADFDGLMEFVQRMYQRVIKETFGTLSTSFQGTTIDWSGTWPRLDYTKLFSEHTGLDVVKSSEKELRAYAKKHRVDFDPSAAKGRLMDLIFKKVIRPMPEVSMQPAFLTHQPVEIEPLAKRDPEQPGVVQRMQVLAAGTELGKGFGELNDPVDQRARFEEQMLLREAGDREAQRLDEEYLEAMEYGMPPAAGFGVSERLFAVLCDKSVRETQIFPLMRE